MHWWRTQGSKNVTTAVGMRHGGRGEPLSLGRPAPRRTSVGSGLHQCHAHPARHLLTRPSVALAWLAGKAGRMALRAERQRSPRHARRGQTVNRQDAKAPRNAGIGSDRVTGSSHDSLGVLAVHLAKSYNVGRAAISPLAV